MNSWAPATRPPDSRCFAHQSGSSLPPLPRVGGGRPRLPERGMNDRFSSRILKHLRSKDPMQLRLDHLEQGFSVYVNGANSELKTSPRKAVHPDFTRSASHAEGTHGEHWPVRPLQRASSFGTADPHPMHVNFPANDRLTYIHTNCARLARKRAGEGGRERNPFFFLLKGHLGLHYPRAKVARAVNSWLLCFIVPVIEGNV